MMNSKKRQKLIRPVPRNCLFCNTKSEPDYKDVGILQKYVTERGKLLGRGRTGMCCKHQRRLARSVKHARHVALLPFVIRA
ncbi:30S ribosomal protein S18 [Patescibacteria group bacterium]|nr:30S ribosomal protein S18 [Patescibacteria group bacterium]MBU1472481.1 30S ribosomal protein S18 [Patescibacteria group bacterium]MBU2460295.1 30S ribosomal protein S18 [Patescibacteria group bacterium]MBU2543847.1 30S ribosomal protein S18 [Patescibacteria group bacterium]